MSNTRITLELALTESPHGDCRGCLFYVQGNCKAIDLDLSHDCGYTQVWTVAPDTGVQLCLPL